MGNVMLHNKGSVTIEYVIVTLLLMIPVWYALMGGSGPWTSTPQNKGNLTKPAVAPVSINPGVVQALGERENDFANAINQP